MSEHSNTSNASVRSPLLGLALILLTNVTSVSIGYILNGEKPDPVDVTCELAAEVAASAECLPETVQSSDEAAIEAEEEAAENQPTITE